MQVSPPFMTWYLLLSRLVIGGVDSTHMKHLAHSKDGCSDHVHCLSNPHPTVQVKGPGRGQGFTYPTPPHSNPHPQQLSRLGDPDSVLVLTLPW